MRIGQITSAVLKRFLWNCFDFTKVSSGASVKRSS